jgi:broad specificity phosphatase PhoE
VLILVRHGRTPYNAERRLLGHLDIPLDPIGCVQARALREVPVLRGAARVVTSPLERARMTAAVLERPTSVDERWSEIDFGVADGQLLTETESIFAKWAGDLSWRPEGGESVSDVAWRVREACEQLWPEAVESDVVVVSHVTPIKLAVCWALGLDASGIHRMFLDLASMSRIGVGRDGGPTLLSFNETHHRPSS